MSCRMQEVHRPDCCHRWDLALLLWSGNYSQVCGWLKEWLHQMKPKSANQPANSCIMFMDQNRLCSWQPDHELILLFKGLFWYLLYLLYFPYRKKCLMNILIYLTMSIIILCRESIVLLYFRPWGRILCRLFRRNDCNRLNRLRMLHSLGQCTCQYSSNDTARCGTLRF